MSSVVGISSASRTGLYLVYDRKGQTVKPSLSKCFVVVHVGSIEGVEGSKHQAPLPARGLLVKSSLE